MVRQQTSYHKQRQFLREERLSPNIEERIGTQRAVGGGCQQWHWSESRWSLKRSPQNGECYHRLLQDWLTCAPASRTSRFGTPIGLARWRRYGLELEALNAQRDIKKKLTCETPRPPTEIIQDLTPTCSATKLSCDWLTEIYVSRWKDWHLRTKGCFIINTMRYE